MLNAAHTHFTIQNDGQIYYQEKANNPLAGVAVAQLRKGDAPLSPIIETLPAALKDGVDKAATTAHLQSFLTAYVNEKLAVLVALRAPQSFDFAGFTLTDDEKDSLRNIARALFDNMGIVDRAAIQNDIDALTTEGRSFLRKYKIRLGPLLAFQPDLNKPAAVRLRAVLYAIYNALDLPVSIPADGSVSVALTDEQQKNKALYKSIGYPVYGNRAIRIDMLDRVINAVYDDASGGKFKAQHKMAEWLGCSIADLYAILTDLGHTKIHDPADALKTTDEGVKNPAKNSATPKPAAQKTVDKPDDKLDDTKTPDIVACAPGTSAAAMTVITPSPDKNDGDNTTSAQTSTHPASDAPNTTAPTPAPKPELATFVLKRGKLSAASKPDAAPKAHRPKSVAQDKKFTKKKGKRNKSENRPKKNMSFAAKTNPEDSPFAVLAALKGK